MKEEFVWLKDFGLVKVFRIEAANGTTDCAHFCAFKVIVTERESVGLKRNTRLSEKPSELIRLIRFIRLFQLRDF
jgi:hypothetical protein